MSITSDPFVHLPDPRNKILDPAKSEIRKLDHLAMLDEKGLRRKTDGSSRRTLSVGSVLAKHSFTAVESGEIVLGPLFVMERMPAGFNYVSGDWKYTMIILIGDIFGETNGQNSERVEYCISCHLAVEQQDHLFFVPRNYRVAPDK